jgi:hypothetical protein
MTVLNKTQFNQFHSFNKMMNKDFLLNEKINKCNKNICIIDENDNIYIKNRKIIIIKNNKSIISIYNFTKFLIILILILILILFSINKQLGTTFQVLDWRTKSFNEQLGTTFQVLDWRTKSFNEQLGTTFQVLDWETKSFNEQFNNVDELNIIKHPIFNLSGTKCEI